MNYYISDLHIGCVNSFDSRTLAHDEILVKNWNSVIHNDDKVYILGDIGRVGNNRDNEHLCSIISRLKGHKILIRGNHDDLRDYRVKQLFESIHDYLEITDNYNGLHHNLVLSHYPIFSWNGCYRGVILLYGHVHDNFDNEIYQNALDDLRTTVCALNQMAEKQGSTRLKKEPYAYNVGAMLKEVNYTPRTLKSILEEE